MLPTLHDRAAEMAALAEVWRIAAAGSPRLVVVSGHRRVGKTFLLTHFLERLDGRAVFYAATRQTERVELARFTEALRPAFGDDPLLASGPGLSSWEIGLSAVAARARSDATAVIIDEAPYLAQATPGFASIVQAVWDRLTTRGEAARLLLVLTGSAASVMDDIVGPNGPLRGRVDLHLRLQPFDLPTVAGILDTEPVRAIETYAACGGWPLHVAAWDPGVPTGENLRRLAGQSGGVLLEDADVILQELPGGPGFGRVLAAIGRGRTRNSAIADDAGQRIEYPLDFLVDSGLVRRETALGAPQRARPEYGIADPYLRFWFRVLYSDRARIQGGQGDAILAQRAGLWQEHLGWVFEDAARDHARRLVRAGVLPPMAVGRWWTTSGAHVEVDVLGLREQRTVLLGEAKWAAGAFDPRWTEALRDRLQHVPGPAPDPMLVIWTRAARPSRLPPDVAVFGPAAIVAHAPDSDR